MLPLSEELDYDNVSLYPSYSVKRHEPGIQSSFILHVSIAFYQLLAFQNTTDPHHLHDGWNSRKSHYSNHEQTTSQICTVLWLWIRARLHWTSAATLQWRTCLSLKSMETNSHSRIGVATHFGGTPFFSIRAMSRASSRRRRWCRV